VSVPDASSPSLAALRRARAHQDAALRRSRLLWRPLFLAIVFVNSFRAHPAPSLHGAGLTISIALGGLTVGAIGVGGPYQPPERVRHAFLGLLFLSAAMLVGLQPAGPGYVGLVVAVAVAAQLVRGPRGVVLAVIAVVFFGVTRAFSGPDRPGPAVLVASLGLIVAYSAVLSVRRLRRSDDQAERLLTELEQTREAQVRAAALGERQHLAREMHDVLAHSLSGLVLQLEGARMLAAQSPADPRLGGVIDRAHHLAKTGLQEARWAIGMLRDEELPGPERLAALVEEFERDSGIPSTLTVTGQQRDLASGTRLALYRVAQEALTNIRKHACPERAEVHVKYEPDSVQLTIEDFGQPGGAQAPGSPGRTDGAYRADGAGGSDGAGRADRTDRGHGVGRADGAGGGDGAGRAVGADRDDGAGRADGGYGLTGMRERAELLGGTLTAGATAEGFRVELRVPA
jgi:signal transduction histidine kinase